MRAPFLDAGGDTLQAHVIGMERLPDSLVYVTTAGYGAYRLKEAQGRWRMDQVTDYFRGHSLNRLRADEAIAAGQTLKLK